MTATFRPSAVWPFTGLIERLSRKANPFLIEAGWGEKARHHAVRDDLVRGIRAAPGGAAITEVSLKATASRLSADASIVARALGTPLAAGQVFFEVKTSLSSDTWFNQKSICALALTGGHTTSAHS